MTSVRSKTSIRKNKQELSRRLALWALAHDCGRTKTAFRGPTLRNAVVEGGRVRIHFDHLGGGLKTRDGGELKHFQIAGQDQKWAWSAAKIEGSEVLVSSSAVPTQSAFVMPGPLGRKAPT